jgi:hypothetical protein
MADYITKGSFNLGNQITLKNKNSNIDRDYGPYENKTLEEIAEELKDTLQIGKTIGVIESGKVVEYWWQPKDEGIKFISKNGNEIKCERCHEQDKGEYIAWVSYNRYGLAEYFCTKEGSPEVFGYYELPEGFPIVSNSYETIIIYGFVKKGGGSEEVSEIVVDSELSLTSTNPIQNQAVANALESKADNSAVEALQTAVEGINTSIPMVVVQNINDKYYISPNQYGILENNHGVQFDTVITKKVGETETGVVNHYMIRFTNYSGYVAFRNWELQWAGGNEPEWEKGKTYEVSIIDNIALWAEIG